MGGSDSPLSPSNRCAASDTQGPPEDKRVVGYCGLAPTAIVPAVMPRSMPRHSWSRLLTTSCVRADYLPGHDRSRLERVGAHLVRGHGAGAWIFTAYVAALYVSLLLLDGPDGLAKRENLFNGHVPGDTVGNAALAGHLLLAVILMGGGPLQLIPQVRARFPTFHRWLGRTYMLTAVASAIAGLYLIWTRPLFGTLVNNIGTSLDGILIIVFAAIALRYAIARNISAHRRWALRLFMVVSAVWFIRIGFNAWVSLTGGAGIDDESFSGPAVVTLHSPSTWCGSRSWSCTSAPAMAHTSWVATR